MEDRKDQLGKRLRTISADLKLYFEKRIELTMLNMGEYVSAWMAASIQRSVGAFLLLGGLCFLLIALAIYLGEILNNDSLGFVLVSLPLLIAGGLFLYLRPKGLFEQLQQRFESEVIKAINQDGRIKHKKIESAESAKNSN
ncbi:MAG: phage holin family protein [Balneolaceae bacterium]|jgi:hypothetical protein